MTDENDTEELTTEGIIALAEEAGYTELSGAMEWIVEGITPIDGGGYRVSGDLESNPLSGTEDYVPFLLSARFGSALEREYPADEE